MQKKILMIGNDSGLPGVKVDIINYTAFFKSPIGGNWYDSEIEIKRNPAKKDLIKRLSELKNLGLDFMIVYFSGHGGQDRETLLELNSEGEVINDSELHNIGKKQITIYDCCRSYPEEKRAALQLDEAYAEFAEYDTRAKYEKRIMQAIPQYSKYLLQSAKNIESEYKLVGAAHAEAAELTIDYCKYLPKENKQLPDAILPKCLSSQQLIIGINPTV